MLEIEQQNAPDEQIIAFVRHVLEQEYAAQIARLIERDEAMFQARRAAFAHYLADPADYWMQRPDPADTEWFIAQASLVAQTRLRELFAIHTYNHPQVGKLFRAVVGPWNNWSAADAYAASYFFAFENGRLRLLAIYDLDRYEEQLGHRLLIGSLRWIQVTGYELRILGEPVGILQVIAPGDPLQHAEYLSGINGSYQELNEESLAPDTLIAFIENLLWLQQRNARQALQHYLADNTLLPLLLGDSQEHVRQLLLICTYEHAKLGDLLGACVGPNEPHAITNYYAYFFAFFDGKLRLCAIYNHEQNDDESGPHINTDGLCWRWLAINLAHLMNQSLQYTRQTRPVIECKA